MRRNQHCLSELHDMKIPSFGVTQHFANKVDWILHLAAGVRLPPLDDASYTNHIACSGYV
jgi:hypothetical protein